MKITNKEFVVLGTESTVREEFLRQYKNNGAPLYITRNDHFLALLDGVIIDALYNVGTQYIRHNELFAVTCYKTDDLIEITVYLRDNHS